MQFFDVFIYFERKGNAVILSDWLACRVTDASIGSAQLEPLNPKT